MYCTFAVPSLWSFRGLTGNYTCTHPAEGITYPHVTSIHADADFFSITCLDEVDNSCMMQSLGFLGVPWSDCACCKMPHSKLEMFQTVHTSEGGVQLNFVLFPDTDTGIVVVTLSEG